MYIIAVIGDLLSLLPGLNVVSGIATGGLLWIAGEVTDINIYSNDEIGKTLLTFLIEEVPVLSILPAWTVRVYFAKKSAREREAVS